MTIGERIKLQRKNLKLTLKEVSQRTKLSTGNLSELENDKYAPSVASLVSLSKALNCSIDWLATGEAAFKEVSGESPIIEERVEASESESRFSEIENDIVMMFRQLDDRDKEDVFDSIKLKYDRAVKKGKSTSLYSTYTEEKENDTKGDTNGKDSGIA